MGVGAGGRVYNGRAMHDYHIEQFTPDETAVLKRFFTNVDRPVFGLVNLPEVVKGALFARYSRTHRSLRRLFLDEFYERPGATTAAAPDGDSWVGEGRAERLYDRVFTQFGDDSVAQLGGAHLACEQASNLLTKVLERGRLAAYLEQSTRYIFYDQKLGGRYRYFVPPEIAESALAGEYRAVMDGLFGTYSTLVRELVPYFEKKYPKTPQESVKGYETATRAKAFDVARGLLPAATLSNVGMFASGQAYEALLLRMQAHPLREAREYGAMMLDELRKMIPSFVHRVDLPDRGVAWSRYLADTAARTAEQATEIEEAPEERPAVSLVEWDSEAEMKVAAAALYPYSDLPDDRLLEIARGMSEDERARVIDAYVGDRRNRRHRPGRGMERVYYRFDVLCDYGIFRDLQRHRMLTLDWQRLGVRHGYVTPEAIAAAGREEEWREAMERAAALHGALASELGADVPQYVVPFAYRIRFFMQMNAREAFHLLELRTVREGHAGYRRVCQDMHRLIQEKAGHRAIADAMSFVDHGEYGVERLKSARRVARRQSARDREYRDSLQMTLRGLDETPDSEDEP